MERIAAIAAGYAPNEGNMRPGVLIGVLAFGLFVGAGFFVFAVTEGLAPWNAAALALQLFAGLAILPLGLISLMTRTPPWKLIRPGHGIRRNAVVAALVFGLLVAATVIIMHTVIWIVSMD